MITGITLFFAAVAMLAGIAAGGAEWEWRNGFTVGGETLHLRLDAISALLMGGPP